MTVTAGDSTSGASSFSRPRLTSVLEQTPSEDPASERDDRRDERLGALWDLLDLQIPLRPSQAASEGRWGESLCGGCAGRIRWVGDDPQPHWRHVDLADLDPVHAAYRDELYDGL